MMKQPLKMFLKSCVCLFGLLLTVLPNVSESATLHAIVATDTNDSIIGSGVSVDRANMEQLMGWIADFTGLTLVPHYLSGNALTGRAVQTVVRDLTVAPDDVIFFYYSGHGYNSGKPSNYFPMLDLDEDIEFSWIHNTLYAKKARLLIALCDACNDIVNFQAKRTGGKLPPNGIPQNFATLFLEQQGYLVAASSKPGESSWSHISQGSYFTIQFLSGLYEEVVNASAPSWEHIMETAGRPIHLAQTPQHPQFTLNVRPFEPRRLAEQPTERPAEQASGVDSETPPDSAEANVPGETDERDYCVTWHITNEYPAVVHVKFYSDDRSRTWPDDDQVYIFNDATEHLITTCGIEKEKICYGAWVADDPAISWGVGKDYAYGCRECCYYAEDVETESISLTE